MLCASYTNMLHRFFKLLYVLALIAIAVSIPVFLVAEIEYSKIVVTTYKVRCLNSDEHLVLYGSQIFSEFVIGGKNSDSWNKKFNFHCQYYDSLLNSNSLLKVANYFEEEDLIERLRDYKEFSAFEKKIVLNTASYPEHFTLEPISDEIQWHQIFMPLIELFSGLLIAFLFLQFLRMSYVYIVFGRVVWHPFKDKQKTGHP